MPVALTGGCARSVRWRVRAGNLVREISRRQAMTLLGGGTVLAADAAFLGSGLSSAWWDDIDAGPAYQLSGSGYAPDGTAGRTAAYPLPPSW